MLWPPRSACYIECCWCLHIQNAVYKFEERLTAKQVWSKSLCDSSWHWCPQFTSIIIIAAINHWTICWFWWESPSMLCYHDILFIESESFRHSWLQRLEIFVSSMASTGSVGLSIITRSLWFFCLSVCLCLCFARCKSQGFSLSRCLLMFARHVSRAPVYEYSLHPARDSAVCP